MDLKRLLFGGGVVKFTDTFTTSYTPAANSTLYTNAYNNWNIYATWTASGGNNETPRINGSEISMSQGSGDNYGMIRLTRSLEGYNTSRPFKMTFSYKHNPYGTGGDFQTYSHYSDVVVAIGGNSSLTGVGTETYGLAFHSRCCTDGNFVRIKNNGTTIGTPYTDNAKNVQYYAHLFYDGTNFKVTRNTSSAEPSSYDFSYTVTDKTQQSATLMIYCYVKGYGDYYGGVKFYDIDEVLL